MFRVRPEMFRVRAGMLRQRAEMVRRTVEIEGGDAVAVAAELLAQRGLHTAKVDTTSKVVDQSTKSIHNVESR